MIKTIWRISIFIPLIVLYMILTTYFTISIPEIKLYWNRSFTLFYCISIIVGWFSCSPLRKSCCNGRFTELLFNLVPVELISMPVFAQWHFAAAIIITLMFVIIEILLFKRVVKEENRRQFSNKRHQHYRGVFKRCSVLIALVLTVIPCILSVTVYKFRSPSFEAEQEVWNMIFSELAEDSLENEIIEDPYASNSILFSCLKKNTWSHFNASERITIMQKLVDFEAEQLGIPSIPVIAEKLDPYTLGQYSDETKEMWIDIKHLMESPVEDCISTICHEVFHSAQHYLISNIDWNNEVFQSSYFDELQSWRVNGENYKSAELSGFDAYENQPLEIAAREYAVEETQRILSYIDLIE